MKLQRKMLLEFNISMHEETSTTPATEGKFQFISKVIFHRRESNFCGLSFISFIRHSRVSAEQFSIELKHLFLSFMRHSTHQSTSTRLPYNPEHYQLDKTQMSNLKVNSSKAFHSEATMFEKLSRINLSFFMTEKQKKVVCFYTYRRREENISV